MTMLARAASRLPAFLRVPLAALLLLLLVQCAAPAFAQPASVAIGVAVQAKSAAAAADAKATTALAQSGVAITALTPAPVAGVVSLNRPLVSGVAPARSIVTLYLNGAAIGTALADAGGAWQITLPAQTNGSYTLVARAAPASGALALTINDPNQPLTDYQGRAAVFDMNNSAAIYYTNGASYTAAADLLASVGATVSGVTAVFGGYADPDGTEYFPNGDFGSTLPTLTASGSLTAALSSGELAITSTSGTGAITYNLAGYKNRAFRMTVQGRKGSITGNYPAVKHSLANSSLGGNNTVGTPATINATAATLYTVYGSQAPDGGSAWYGVQGTGIATGTMYLDNWSLREVMPMAGWGAFAAGQSAAAGLGWTAVIDAVMPAAAPATGTKIVAQLDSGGELHKVVLAYGTTGRLSLTMTSNNSTSTTLDLGAVAVSTRARVAFSINQGTNGFTTGVAASLNGGPRIVNTAATANAPGIAFVRLGKDSAGSNLFDGTYNQVAFLADKAPADWLEYSAAQVSANVLVSNGDSYMNGANGVAGKTALATATGLPVADIAVGGSTFAAQRDVYLAKPYLRGARVVHWDGSDNGTVDVATDVAIAQAIVAAKGDSRVLWVMPLPVPNPGTASSSTPTAQATRAVARKAAFIAAFGTAKVFDPLPTLQALGNGSTDDNNDIAAGPAPRSTLFDASSGQVHLSQAAMTAVANAIATRERSRRCDRKAPRAARVPAADGSVGWAAGGCPASLRPGAWRRR